MKVLFVNDSTSNANWGDRAAATSLRKMILDAGGEITGVISEEELGLSSFANPVDVEARELPALREGAKEKLKLLIPPLFLKLREKVKSIPNAPLEEDIVPHRWDDFEKNLSRLLSQRRQYSLLLDAIDGSDVLVMHGDGCMTGCGRIARAQLFLAFAAKREFGKKVIMVNHTADFSNPVLLRMAQGVYPLFDDVVYRETISAERNVGLCKGRHAPDTAHLFQPISKSAWGPVARRSCYFDVWPDIADFDPVEPYICIGGSGIYHYHRQYDAVNGFVALIEQIRSIYSGQIVLTVSDLRDQSIFRPVAKKLGLPLVGLFTPLQQVVDVIGNARAYVGGRWHPSIFALRGGAPIVSLTTNTFMMQALAQMTGLTARAFDALNLEREKEAIALQLLTLLDQGEELRVTIRAWAESASKKSRENVAFLAKMRREGEEAQVEGRRP